MEQQEQTAVEYLISQLPETLINELKNEIEKAKDMELQQLDDYYHGGWADARTAILHS